MDRRLKSYSELSEVDRRQQEAFVQQSRVWEQRGRACIQQSRTSKAGPWQEKARPGRRKVGPRRGKAGPRRTPSQRNSMSQGLRAEKQVSGALRQSTFTRKIKKWDGRKMFGPHRSERIVSLAENGKAQLRHNKAGPSRSKPVYFQENI